MTDAEPYGPNFGGMQVDPDAMEEFAKVLRAEVANGYNPVMSSITTAMAVDPPDAVGFPELLTFLEVHRSARYATYSNAWNFQDGTDNLAIVAHTISEKYRGADAFAKATLDDVNDRFDDAAGPRISMDLG